MNSSKLVSIIMPAYNSERYIAESIESVLVQTYQNWELIIVDDGSTDLTAEIVKEKADLDDRIKYFYQTNSRQAKARNLGLLNTRGDLVAFLDADDLWLKNKLEVMIEEFKRGNQDLLFSDSYVFEGSFDIDRIEEGTNRMLVASNEYFGYEGLSNFLEINRIPILTVIAHSHVIKKIGFNESVVPAEDYDLWIRMLILGYKLRSISQPLAAYRLHSSASTSGDRLVTDVCIRMIQSHKVANMDPELNKLFDEKLKVWYNRNLALVKDSKQLSMFFDCLRENRALTIPLAIIAKFNFNNRSIYKLNKRLVNKAL